MTAKNVDKVDIPFEKAITELEGIVEEMELGNIPLDESLKMYQRGVHLLKICNSQINAVQKKVEILDKETLKIFPSD